MAKLNRSSSSAVEDPEGKKFRKREKQLFWLLVATGFLLYSSSIGFGYVLDDVAVISQNKFVQLGFGGMGKILTTFYWQGYWDLNAGLYRPLSLIMFATEWGISPNNPALSHFVNVLLYALSTGLVFRFSQKILPAFPLSVPFFVALLFAVHPLHTEVVANIKSRDELLSLLFLLLILLELSREQWSRRTFVLTGIYFFLSLLSKEAAILYLPVALIYLALFRKPGRKYVLRIAAVLGAVAGMWLVVHQAVIRSADTKPVGYTYRDNSLVLCGKAEQAATGIGLFGKYVEKTVLPLRLTYDYSFAEISCLDFASPAVWLIVACTLLLLAFCWKKRKTYPELLFGVLFFVVTISLATNVVFLIGTTFAERLAYTPSLGLIILFVAGTCRVLQRFTPSSRIYAGIMTAVGIVFFAGAYNRSQFWESGTKLFAQAVRTGSSSARVYSNYGTSLMQQAEAGKQTSLFEQAIVALNCATAIDPTEANAWVNLGVCYFRVEKFKESAAATEKALSFSPHDTLLYFNLADAYFNLQRLKDAEQWYLKGIHSGKTKLGDYERLGSIYFNEGKFNEALDVYQTGLERLPDNESLLMNSGNCYGALGNYRKAAETFYAAYRANPSNARALELLRMSEARGGFRMRKQ